jgi:predicted transcriptional regulator
VTARSDLEARRIQACRLDSDVALDEFDDAIAFLEDRGLLTLTPCCSLPSLFGACHEEAHSPGKAGYGKYPKTRWWWGGALAATDGVLAAKLHQGKSLYLSARLVELLDPLCRSEIGRAEAGEYGGDADRVTRHLAAAGPCTTDDLKVELGLDARHYQRARHTLERRGVVISRQITVDTEGGGHRHLSELTRWDQLVKPGADHVTEVALGDLLVAVVEAAVILPASEAQRAFTWTIPTAVIDEAVNAGRIVRLDDVDLAVSSM